MAGLCVITHNGKLPKDGGKRIGYGVPGWYFVPLRIPAVVMPWPWTPKEPVQEYPKAEIHYDGDFSCKSCGTWTLVAGIGSYSVSEKVKSCRECGKKHRVSRR